MTGSYEKDDNIVFKTSVCSDRCKSFPRPLQLFSASAANIRGERCEFTNSLLVPKDVASRTHQVGHIPLNMALTARTMSTKKHSLIEIGLAGCRHAVFL